MNCIYKIVIHNTEDRYIGSCKELRLRKATHKCAYYKNKLKLPLYESIRKVGWENIQFLLLDCNILSEEIEKREQFWIDEVKPNLNCIAAYTSIYDKKKYQNKYNNMYNKPYYERTKHLTLEKSKEIGICNICDQSMRKDSIKRRQESKYGCKEPKVYMKIEYFKK